MIYIASTFRQRAIGFQFRHKIDDDEAMIFKGIGPGASFHMRNVHTPLKIASLNKDNEVLGIGYMEPITGTYTTTYDSEHAFEASPAFFSHFGIRTGGSVGYLLEEIGCGSYDWNQYYRMAEKTGDFGRDLLV